MDFRRAGYKLKESLCDYWVQLAWKSKITTIKWKYVSAFSVFGIEWKSIFKEFSFNFNSQFLLESNKIRKDEDARSPNHWRAAIFQNLRTIPNSRCENITFFQKTCTVMPPLNIQMWEQTKAILKLLLISHKMHTQIFICSVSCFALRKPNFKIIFFAQSLACEFIFFIFASKRVGRPFSSNITSHSELVRCKII